MRGGWRFTLIELLVVVGIIAILASLLLPALRGARESAKTLKCLSNEKQVMLGMFSYTTDFADHFPMVGYAPNMNDWWSQPTSNPWSMALFDNGYLGAKNSEGLPARGHLLFCDADTTDFPGTWQLKRSFGIGVGCVWNGTTYASTKTTAIKVPTSTVGLGESYGAYNFLRGESCLAYYTLYSGDTLSNYGHAGQRANFAFCDGHAVTARFGQTSGFKFDNN